MSNARMMTTEGRLEERHLNMAADADCLNCDVAFHAGRLRLELGDHPDVMAILHASREIEKRIRVLVAEHQPVAP